MNLEKTLEVAVPIFLIVAGAYALYEIKKEYDLEKKDREYEKFVERLRGFGL